MKNPVEIAHQILQEEYFESGNAVFGCCGGDPEHSEVCQALTAAARLAREGFIGATLQVEGGEQNSKHCDTCICGSRSLELSSGE